jgi:hypothetical protein
LALLGGLVTPRVDELGLNVLVLAVRIKTVEFERNVELFESN